MRCGWLLSTPGYFFLIVLFLGTVACPTLGTAAGPYLLKDVWVIQQGGQWHVVLVGSESMTYKAIEASNPLRVVVDLHNTLSKPMITSPIRENDMIGRVKSSTVAHDPKPLTRVEIFLSRDVSYEISRKQQKIWISFTAPPPISGAEPSHIEPAVQARADVSPSETKAAQATDSPQPSAEKPERVAKEPLPPASKILAIEPVTMEEDFDVHIIGDGRFNNYDVSLLRQPPRLVVDLLGIKSTEVKADLILSSPWANRVRVGQHAEKVRVVFDLNFTPKGELPFRVTLEENRLVVSLLPSAGFPSQ